MNRLFVKLLCCSLYLFNGVYASYISVSEQGKYIPSAPLQGSCSHIDCGQDEGKENEIMQEAIVVAQAIPETLVVSVESSSTAREALDRLDNHSYLADCHQCIRNECTCLGQYCYDQSSCMLALPVSCIVYTASSCSVCCQCRTVSGPVNYCSKCCPRCLIGCFICCADPCVGAAMCLVALSGFEPE